VVAVRDRCWVYERIRTLAFLCSICQQLAGARDAVRRSVPEETHVDGCCGVRLGKPDQVERVQYCFHQGLIWAGAAELLNGCQLVLAAVPMRINVSVSVGLDQSRQPKSESTGCKHEQLISTLADNRLRGYLTDHLPGLPDSL